VVETIFREIDELIKGGSNSHIEQWHGQNKPVVGYFCHYIPTELILAVGALPVRLRGAGAEDSSLGDAWMSQRVCTYVRHVVSLVLNGEYDFLTGIISSNSCDHVRRAADVFNKKTSLGLLPFVSIPRTPRESLYSYFLNELRTLYRQLSETLGQQPTDERLREAIITLNETRRRLGQLQRYQMAERPKLSGKESLAVHIAAQVLPPTVFHELADQLLAALPNRTPLPTPRARLLLLGAELDEPAYIAAIESVGALVVADRVCFGARSVLEPLDADAPDPLDTIGRAYFFRPSCARMMGAFPERWDQVQRVAREAKADGIVFERLIFCDPWGADQHNLTSRAQLPGALPLLALMREYGLVPTGQLRTRVQAFVERIEIAAQRRKSA